MFKFRASGPDSPKRWSGRCPVPGEAVDVLPLSAFFPVLLVGPGWGNRVTSMAPNLMNL